MRCNSGGLGEWHVKVIIRFDCYNYQSNGCSGSE